MFFVEVVAILAVFGFPAGLVGLFLRQRHHEKMRLLETQANTGRVAMLEEARAELEVRVRTLETIVTGGDQDLEERLRKLSSAEPSTPDRPRLKGRER